MLRRSLQRSTEITRNTKMKQRHHNPWSTRNSSLSRKSTQNVSRRALNGQSCIVPTHARMKHHQVPCDMYKTLTLNISFLSTAVLWEPGIFSYSGSTDFFLSFSFLAREHDHNIMIPTNDAIMESNGSNLNDNSIGDDNGGWDTIPVASRSTAKRKHKGGTKKQLSGTTGAGVGKGESKAKQNGWSGSSSFGKSSWSGPRKTEDPSTSTSQPTSGEQTSEPTTTHSSASSFLLQTPLSTLLEKEYGEYDPNWKKQEPTVSSTGVNQESSVSSPTNRLGSHGKAPIHVTLISFGYHYGAPSSLSSSTMIHDCRTEFPELVPYYMIHHDALSSGLVKRFFHQHLSYTLKDVSKALNSQIMDRLNEKQKHEGYGYAMPLQFQVYIGSEYGRHRSVMLVEKTATALRSYLRTEAAARVDCPCSVETLHRDIQRPAVVPDHYNVREKRSSRKEDDSDDEEV